MSFEELEEQVQELINKILAGDKSVNVTDIVSAVRTYVEAQELGGE